MINSYKTIKSISEGIYKEKGSKFLSFAHHVQNIDEIKEIVANYKKEYYDARHVCYAYMLGAEREIFRTNDDGEPSGTAGKPILGQINSHELTNILIVVIRYFGGVLLGTSGLITAYKEATIEAIKNATIEEKMLKRTFKIEFGYEIMSDVIRTIRDHNATIDNMKMEYNCTYKVTVLKEIAENFQNRIEKIYGTQCTTMN